MTRERIKDFKEIVLPFFTNYLLKKNYENLGKSDAEEFEKDFSEIIELADKALEQQPCEDTISRQAAIDALRNRWLKTINFDGIGEDIAEECEICLRTVPSAQPEQRWIPVSERLPEYGVPVLVSIDIENIFVGIAWRSGPRWILNTNTGGMAMQDIEIKAWMPLPAPYVNEEPPTDGCYGCKHRIIRSVPTSKFYCDLDDVFHDNLTNCPLEQDAPSASEIRGEMFYADMGDDE